MAQLKDRLHLDDKMAHLTDQQVGFLMIGERPDADFGLGRTSVSQAMARQGGSEAPHGYKLPVVLLYPGGWMPRTK